jgi:hypothetical protein
MPAGQGWPVILAKAGPALFWITSRVLPIRQCFCCNVPDLLPSPAALHGFTRAMPENSHEGPESWFELS